LFFKQIFYLNYFADIVVRFQFVRVVVSPIQMLCIYLVLTVKIILFLKLKSLRFIILTIDRVEAREGLVLFDEAICDSDLVVGRLFQKLAKRPVLIDE
jgi:hypothetical protein